MKSRVVAHRSKLRAAREVLVEASRRAGHLAHEAEDLAHDIIVSTLRRESRLDADALIRTASGAARRHGAFVARTAARRRAREISYAQAASASDPIGSSASAHTPLPTSLSPALRTTLLLLLSTLKKAELRVALGISDAALRKRFQALRSWMGPVPRPELPQTPTRPLLRRSHVELLPRIAGTRGADAHAQRVLAVGDPDGHGIILAQSLTPGAPAATTGTICSTHRSRTSRSSSS